jgi:hypothetical protein
MWLIGVLLSWLYWMKVIAPYDDWLIFAGAGMHGRCGVHFNPLMNDSAVRRIFERAAIRSP